MDERTIVSSRVGAAAHGSAPSVGVLMNFAAEAGEGGARVLDNFALLDVGGVNVQIVAGDSRLCARFWPCLAAGGLAVAADSTARATMVSRGQTLQVAFFNAARTAYRPLTIESLVFSAALGGAVGPANDGFISVMTDRGTLAARMSDLSDRAARGDPFFADTRFVLFGCIDEPFSVAAIGADDAPVSNPLSGLRSDAGLGFAARRKKNA